MPGVADSTPLMGLGAVVLETETVGQDPAQARLTEVAALLVIDGNLDERTSWRRVREREESIEQGASEDEEADINGVASFPNLWPELEVLIGDRVLIGHGLDFDLAVLKNECERGGFAWQPPRNLDVSLLARVLRPDLPGYSLPELAAWLEIETDAHPSAYRDALLAGKIFLALAPKLQDVGIRTLADAERSCRELIPENRHNLLGLMSNIDAAVRAIGEKPPRIDAYPYRHRVAEVMSPSKFIGRDATVGNAIRRLERDRVSSLFVAPSGREDTTFKPQELGIITERDMLRAVADHGTAALFMPINSIVSAPLLTVPADAYIYRALGRMNRLDIRHLGVVDESGQVCGAVSARDLSRLRKDDVGGLGDAIDEADDVTALARAWRRVAPVVQRLLEEGMSGADAAGVIAREIGALTRRAGMLARKLMTAEGMGPPPSPYALVVLGAAGRGESLLAPEQNHAILFTAGEPGSDADKWFAQLSDRTTQILTSAGVPAPAADRDDHLRGAIPTWRTRVREWMAEPAAAPALARDFFDMRAVHGDFTVADTVRADAFEAAKNNAALAKWLAQSTLPHRSRLAWFAKWRKRDDTLDLGQVALARVSALALAYALREGVMERSTISRLLMIEALELAPATEVNAFSQAYDRALEVILRRQLADIAQGAPPTTTIRPRQLPRAQAETLQEILRAARQAEQRIRAFETDE